MRAKITFVPKGRSGAWLKLMGLMLLLTLNPPAFLLAQNLARGIKFERLGLEQGTRAKHGHMYPARQQRIHVIRHADWTKNMRRRQHARIF
ncbi:MAG: hypothetical protein ONB46_02275 [candidate division KSB1 bacterium]|nr:hypothetical protein [candidate division KSB1 bacterium]MDZ7364493.1 hypothetical protein [candidate division KSB1 bacterium]